MGSPNVKSPSQGVKALAWVLAALFVGIQFVGLNARVLSNGLKLLQVGSNTASTTTSPPKIAQFGASIFLGGPGDYEIDPSTNRSQCFGMVDRVVQYKNINYVQFVPTLYWYDTGPNKPYPTPDFDPSCKGADLSTYYCFSRFNVTEVDHWCMGRSEGTCPEITDSQLENFKTGVGSCMKYAASKGLNIAVNAHVDDGRALGGWRNTIKFDPTKKYGTYSYEEIILNPLADMLGAAAAAGSEVEFTLQGEMGATVFAYPNEWMEVADRIRNRIVTLRAQDGRAGPVLVGIGANNLKACGCEYIGIVDAYEYLKALNSTFDPSKYPDLPAVKQLYKSVDFIGISAYIPMPVPDFEMCQLEGLLERMDIELALYNMSLTEITDAGTELHYSEYGVGGGTSQSGDVPAKTAKEAAYTPFFGIAGQYTCAKDPFQMCTPDQPNENGCKYHGVKRAFIWGLGSWDVLAIYPGDRSAEGSWTDAMVVAIISCHNSVAQGGGDCNV